VIGSLALAPVAAQSTRAAPKSASSSFATLSSRADAARDANRLDDARALYKQALALRPSWAEGWWSLGTIAYDRDSYAEAARAFRNAVKLAPKNGTAYVMLGLSEFELGQDDLALQHIQKGANLGLDKDPELRHVALYHQGVLQQRKGQFQSAQETLEQLCLQGVESDEVAVALGMTLLRDASKTPPPRGRADAEIVRRVGGAGCLAGQRRFDEGRAAFTTLVSQHPTYRGIHYAFGLFLVEASDLPAAVAEFKEEIKNNPADVVSRLQIAAANYKIDSASGLPYAQEAVKLAPQQPFGHYLLGMLLLDVDDYEKAIPELEVARKAFPRESRLDLALSTAYSRAGRKQDAARMRAEFQRLNESGSAEEATPGATDIRVGDAPPH
jgi:tetratricopeptide (TPR) repeat protein